MPSDFSKEGGVLHTIPSVIDLPSAGNVGMAERRNGTGVKGRGNDARVKQRFSGVDKVKVKRPNEVNEKVDEKEDKDKDGEPIKHYDADGESLFPLPLSNRLLTIFFVCDSAYQGSCVRWHCNTGFRSFTGAF